MSGTAWALLAAALLVFWAIGAYNRLVGLRNAIGAAFAELDEPLRRRRDALPALLAALRDPLPEARAALDGVAAALAQNQAAADALRARPSSAAAAASFSTAEAVQASAIARLLSLPELQADELRRRADIAAWLRELHDADLRYAFARQRYNDAVGAYNAAVRQQPTRLLAAIFGFATAGTIAAR
jgi:LemA protein